MDTKILHPRDELLTSIREFKQACTSEPPKPRAQCTAEYHQALKTEATWATLPLVDRWVFPDCVLEMRNCPRCHSTLAKEVQP